MDIVARAKGSTSAAGAAEAASPSAALAAMVRRAAGLHDRTPGLCKREPSVLFIQHAFGGTSETELYTAAAHLSGANRHASQHSSEVSPSTTFS
eukprot:CAMPEP_0182559358 /NCGR_PEP_ID=MMETSP1324-20130603/2508_1 /TAXON_ID=236786 /ORGANISM="Florenciella sp., Strain RCC1587" /LENGTH=93 /DNA_ID=CAMNT_0024771605 /DNA_START=1284 /DNA_END=1562 /DNA_ORIENTATION=+